MEQHIYTQIEKHKDKIEVLMEYHALEMRNGTVTLSFDNDGTLKDIEKKEKVYKRLKNN